jgi:hypothetical protein
MPSLDTTPATTSALPDLNADLRLIRASLLMLLFMTTAFSGATWNAMHNDPTLLKSMEAIPVMLLSVVCFIVTRIYLRADEIGKVCAHPVPDRESAAPGH